MMWSLCVCVYSLKVIGTLWSKVEQISENNRKMFAKTTKNKDSGKTFYIVLCTGAGVLTYFAGAGAGVCSPPGVVTTIVQQQKNL